MRRCGTVSGLAGVALLLVSAPALAQPPGRGPAGGLRTDVVPIDACGIATLDQFRFLIAAGLGRALPVTRTSDGERVVVASPTIGQVNCSPLHVELQVPVTRLPASGAVPDSSVALAHLGASFVAKASFHSDSAKTARTPSALESATLCVSSIDVARVEPRSGAGIDRARLRAWLNDALHDQCFDITSLVYVFLERGGTVSPMR